MVVFISIFFFVKVKNSLDFLIAMIIFIEKLFYEEEIIMSKLKNPKTLDFAVVFKKIGKLQERLIRFKEKSCGITKMECFAFHMLAAKDSAVTMKELATELRISFSRATHIADSLMAKGWIQRKNNEKDRRSLLVSLSKEGRDSFNAYENRLHEFYDDILSEIDPAKHEQLYELFKELGDAWEKVNEETKDM